MAAIPKSKQTLTIRNQNVFSFRAPTVIILTSNCLVCRNVILQNVVHTGIPNSLIFRCYNLLLLFSIGSLFNDQPLVSRNNLLKVLPKAGTKSATRYFPVSEVVGHFFEACPRRWRLRVFSFGNPARVALEFWVRVPWSYRTLIVGFSWKVKYPLGITTHTDIKLW